MDYLQKAINKFRADKIEVKNLPFCEILKPTTIDWSVIGAKEKRKINGVIDNIKSMRCTIQSLYCNYATKSKEEKKEINKSVEEIREKCISQISNIYLTENEMYVLLKEIDKDRNAGYSRTIFDTLFATGNKTLYNAIRNNSNCLYKITKKTNENSILLFDCVYFKQKIG